VKSVSDLLGNERLITYAMKAYGLDAKTESRVLVRDMLLGGITDPQSPYLKRQTLGRLRVGL
jgi:hypothetical protein